MPSGVLIDPSPSVIDTALRWTANTEPDLAGYEVVWRSTSCGTKVPGLVVCPCRTLACGAQDDSPKIYQIFERLSEKMSAADTIIEVPEPAPRAEPAAIRGPAPASLPHP